MERIKFEAVLDKFLKNVTDYPYKPFCELKAHFLLQRGGDYEKKDPFFDIRRNVCTYEALDLRDGLLKYYEELGISLPIEVRVGESLTKLFRRPFPLDWTYRLIRQRVKYCDNELLRRILDAGRERGAYNVFERKNKRNRPVVYWSVKSLGLVCPINYEYLRSLMLGLEWALKLSFDGDYAIILGMPYLVPLEDMKFLKEPI
jgi:hypothetical protein